MKNNYTATSVKIQLSEDVKNTKHAVAKSAFVKALAIVFLMTLCFSQKSSATGITSGNYTIGPTGTHASLAAFITALNGSTLSGNVTAEFQTTYTEAAMAAQSLTGWTSGGFTVTIRPISGASNLVTSGTPTGPTALITINGATCQNLIFDGRAGGSGAIQWTIKNLQITTGGPVITFINDANLNTIQYVDLQGAASANLGIVTFSTAAGSGNSSNTIDHCLIHNQTTTYPINGVYSSGTAGHTNASNTITNNTISNCTTNYINITATGNGDSWNISNNTLFQAAFTGTVAQVGINFLAGSNSNTISYNTIGGQAVLAGGSAWTNSLSGTVTPFTGIAVSAGTGTATAVDGDTIRNINLTGIATGSYTMALINVTAGNVNIGSNAGNVIGSKTTANSIINGATGNGFAAYTAGINAAVAAAQTVNIKNNVIANLHAGPVTGGIYLGVRGIMTGTTGIYNISSDTINTIIVNQSNNTGSGASATGAVGILDQSGTAGQTISNNTITNVLDTTSAGASYTAGIYFGNSSLTSGTNVISGNTITNIKSNYNNSSVCNIFGIDVEPSGTTVPVTVSNNMVSLGAGLTGTQTIYGIYRNATGTDNFYFNTVLITGNQTSALQVTNCYAMYSVNTTGTQTYNSNIFVNTRFSANTNCYGFYLNGPTGVTSDYNDVYSVNSGLTFYNQAASSGYSLAVWQSSIGKDANSKCLMPTFASTTSLTLTTSAGNYCLYNAGQTGTGVTTDILGSTRTNAGEGSPARPTIGCYEFTSVPSQISGSSWTVGSTGSGDNFNSLTEALSALNCSSLSSAVTFNLTSNYLSSNEPAFPVIINPISGASSTNTITIRPNSGASPVITSSVSGVLVFNGAKYFKITGTALSGSTLLTLQSTYTSGAAVVGFTNGAQNDTVAFCKLKAPVSGYGVQIGTTPAAGVGNSNNGIVNDSIFGYAAYSSWPVAGIVASGNNTATSSQYNVSNYIANNFIYNFTNYGVLVQSGCGDGWSISNNSFFNNAGSGTGIASQIYFIDIAVSNAAVSALNNYTISGNYIGGQAPQCGGGYFNCSYTGGLAGSNSNSIFGIFGQFGGSASGTGHVISGNTIQNINMSSTSSSQGNGLEGIYVSAGSVTVSGNVIGSDATSQSIKNDYNNSNGCPMIGIEVANGSVGYASTISNNVVANMVFTGANAGGYSHLAGIAYGSTAAQPVTISGNKIHDLTATAATSSSFNTLPVINNGTVYGGIAGIAVYTLNPTTITIRSDTIYNLFSNYSSVLQTGVWGIITFGQTTGSHVVERNFVHHLYANASNTSAFIIGIGQYSTAGPTTYKNNMVQLGYDASNSPISASHALYGIYLNAATRSYATNVYNNTVYIGGTGSSVSRYCIIRSSDPTNNNDDIRNNIFINNTTGGSANQYCISLNDLTKLSTLDYNLYYTNYPTSALDYIGFITSARQTLANWQTGTSLESHSLFTDPNLVAPIASQATTNLHTQVPSPASGNGVTIGAVTNDYEGVSRPQPSGTNPDIGANELSTGAYPIITYTTLGNACNNSNVTLSGVTITSTGASGIPLSGSYVPQIWYRKSNGTASNWTNKAGSYVSGTGASSVWNFTIDYSQLSTGTPGVSDVIQYYIVAQDGNTTPSTTLGYNPAPGALHTDVLTQTSAPTTPNSYVLSYIGGSVTVGSSGTFTSLTGAAPGGLFATLNTYCITGNVTAVINSDITETGANTLNTWNDGGSNYSLTIVPDSVNSTVRTLSGTAVGSNAPMISVNFSAVNRTVIINGSSNKYLAFRNTGSAATVGSVITLAGTSGTFGVASGSMITNCDITSNGSTANTNAAIQIGTGTNTVTISNCNIHDATAGTTGAVATGIYSNNATNTVTVLNNNIYNWTTGGVNLASVAAGSSVTNNKFYFSFNSGVATAQQTAITIAGAATAGNLSVTGNYIGGQSSSPGGSAWTNSSTTVFTGISMTGATLSTNSPSEIYGNTIQNLAFSGAGAAGFTGITASGFVNIGYDKSGTSATGDTIGGSKSIAFTGTSSTGAITGITVTANTSSITAGTFIANNTVSNISTTASVSTTSAFTGISAVGTGGASVTTSIQNNLINTITLNGTGAESFTGIIVTGSSTNTIACGNVAANIIGNTSVPTSIQNKGTGATIGITVTTSANSNIISGNTVGGFTNNNATPAFTGIAASVGSVFSTEIGNNTIQNLTLSGVGAFTGISATGLFKIGVKNADSTAFGNTIGSTGSVTNIQFGSTAASYGINLSSSPTANGSIISNNTIAGLTGTAAGGSNTFTGIFATGSSTGPVNEIANNQIALISIAGTTTAGFTGINAATGLYYIGVKKDGSAAGNTIGDPNSGVNYIKLTGVSTAPMMGISVGSGSSAANQVSNNLIGDFITLSASATTPITGININAVSTTNPTLVQANTIKTFSLASASASATFTGINAVAATTGAVTIGGATSGLGNIIGGTSGANTIVTPSTGFMIGISITGTSAVAHTVSNNIINGFTTSSTAATAASIEGIYLNATSSLGNTISANTISSFSVTSTGTASVYGIYHANTAATAASIQGNIIKGFTLSNTSTTPKFAGIYVPSGFANIGNTSGNIIGDPALPINYAGTSTTAGQPPASGIYYAGGGSPALCSNNIIQNINVTSAGAAAGPWLTGIYYSNASSTGTVGVSGNTVKDLSSAAICTNSSLNSAIVGMYVNVQSLTGGANTLSVTGNTVDSLVDNAAAAVDIIGMWMSSGTGTGHVFGQNLIHSFSTANTAAVQIGIYPANNVATYQNNMIRLGLDNQGTGIATSTLIYGFYFNNNNSGNNFINNTVYIGGSSVGAGAANTYCFYKPQPEASCLVENNIFFNARSNGAGTGKHYACYYTSAANFTGTTSNYNIYDVSGTGGVLTNFDGTTDRTTIAAIRTASGNDQQSAVGDPKLYGVSGTGDGAGVWTSGTGYNNLSLYCSSTTSLAWQAGLTISGVTTDIFGTTIPSPANIGADATNTQVSGCTVSDIYPPQISYTAIPNQTNTSNFTLNGVTITDQGTGVPLSGGNIPRIYYRSTFNGTATAWASTAGTYSVGTTTNSTWSFTIDYSQISGYTPTLGDTIQYFVVAQDQATPNVGANPYTNNTQNGVNDNTPAHFSTPNSYKLNFITGSVNVGSGQRFTSLTQNNGQGLFNYINGTTVTGSVTAVITSDITETGAITLNTWTESGGTYSLTITPDGTTLRTLSATAVAGTNLPMIPIAIPKVVRIDGSNGGDQTIHLTIWNTNSTAGNTGPTIQFSGGAVSGSGIYYTNVENNATISTAGAITVGTGTNNVTIQNDSIHNAITGHGTPGAVTTGIYNSANASNTLIVQNNYIFNFSTRGIFYNTTVGNGQIVSGNHFYYSLNGGTNLSVSNQLVIDISGGSGHSIYNNFIGGQGPNCGTAGNFWTNVSSGGTTYGINLAVGTSPVTYVYGNTIQNMAISNASLAPTFMGINVSSGLVNIGIHQGTISGNTIGDPATSSPKEIKAAGTAVIHTLYGINVTSTVAGDSIIGNTIANLNTAAAAQQYNVYGINGNFTTVTTSGTIIKSNTITLCANNGTGASQLYGIWVPSTNTQVIQIKNNTIGSTTSLTSMQNKGTGVTYGIFAQTASAVGNSIDGNTVAGYTNTSTSAFNGIFLNAGTTYTSPSEVINNTVQNLSFTGAPSAPFMGINVAAGYVNVGVPIAGGTGGNTIGDPAGVDSISFSGTMTQAIYGMQVTSASSSRWQVSNNTIAYIRTRSTSSSAIFFGINPVPGVTTLSPSLQNNTINNIVLGGTGASPFTLYGIYSASNSAFNVGGTTGNKIYTLTNLATGAANTVGIYLAPVTPAAGYTDTISNNRIGNNSAGDITSSAGGASITAGIYYSNAAANTTAPQIVSDTIQGFTVNAAAAGTDAVYGIYFNTNNTAVTTNVQGNKIRTFNITGSVASTFKGIYAVSVATAVNIGGTTGNTVGDPLGTAYQSIQYAGTSTCYGIYCSETTTPGTITISNDTIANITASNAASTVQCVGIFAANTASTTAVTVNANTVNYLKSMAANTGAIAGGAASVIGVSVSALSTGGISVNQNTVHTLSNLTTSAVAVNVAGIYASGATSGTQTVSKNKVYCLNLGGSTTSASNMYGIYIPLGTSLTAANNMVRLGISETGSGITGVYSMYGMVKAAAVNQNYYYNSVYIGGSGVTAGADSSFAFRKTASGAADVVKFNIFMNARTYNSGATGLNFAVGLNSTLGLTEDTNLLYVTDATFGYIGLLTASQKYQTLSAWQGSTPGLDNHSFNSDPQFITPGTQDNTATGVYIYAYPSCAGHETQIESGGSPTFSVTISDDIDGTARTGYPKSSQNCGGGTRPDLGANEADHMVLDLSQPSVTATISNTCNSTSASITGITITDASGVNTTSGTNPRLYYKKHSDGTNSWTDNTSSSAGWKYVEATNSSSPFSFTIDYTHIFGGTVSPADVIDYFVAAQDLANNTNVGISSGTLATSQFNGDTYTLSNFSTWAFPIGGSPATFSILPCSGTVTVGSSGASYTSLTNTGGLFQQLNSVTLTGNLTANIITDLSGETGTFTANMAGSPGSFTVTIQPNNTTGRTISGAVTTSPMIPVSGANAKNIVIDGQSGDGLQHLTFRNTGGTASTAGPVIQFDNGAANDSIRNCLIESNSTNTTSGAIVFGITTGTSGITVALNNIHPSSGNALANGIYNNFASNVSNIIRSNNIYDFSTDGVLLNTSSGNNWSINGNSFYMTATVSTTQIGVSMQGGTGHAVANNFIGGSSSGASGTWTNSGNVTLAAIAIGGSATATVAGNTIQNFSMTVTAATTPIFYGININTTGATTDSANTISAVGVNNATGAGSITGIIITGSGAAKVQSNMIGSTGTANSLQTSCSGGVKGISSSSSSTGTLIGGNTAALGNTIANLTSTTSTTAQVIGIIVSAGTNTVQNNTIGVLTNSAANNSLNASSAVIGILNSTTSAAQVTSNNKVSRLFGSTSSPSIIGICLSSTGVHTAAGNFIHNFASSTATSVQTGLSIIAPGASSVFKNNMVALGVDTSGTDITNSAAITGILKASTTASSVYNNSVYIGGSSITGSSVNTYAFRQTGTASDDIRDNIFVNARSNASGTAIHYAYVLNSTTIGSSDYNIYYAPGTGGNIASTNTGTTAITLQGLITNLSAKDIHSGVGNPNFLAPSAQSYLADLHLNSATPAEGTGILIASVTDDYDGQTRSGLSPTDIGADAGSFTTVGAGTDIFAPIVTVSSITSQAPCSGALSIPVTATVTDVGTGVPAAGNTYAPQLWWRLSTGTWASVAPTASAGSTYSYTLTVSSGVTGGQTYQYYVAAQDQATTPNIGYSNYNATSPVHSDVITAPSTPNGNPATFTTVSTTPLTGTVNVGTGQTYTTLTGASNSLFAAINAGGLSGNVTALITSNTAETGATALNQWTEYCGSGYTLTIAPSSATTYSLSGSVTTSVNGLIPINGADRVTIDGRYNGTGTTSYLKFQNTNGGTSAAATVQFYNSSANDTIRYCYLEGQGQNTSQGVVTLNSASSVVLDNNTIYGGSGSSFGATNVIYAAGVSGNHDIAITNNNIYNFIYSGGGTSTRSYGINVLSSNGSNWKITGNSIYNPSSNGQNVQSGIGFAPGSSSTGDTISGNYVGGSSPHCGTGGSVAYWQNAYSTFSSTETKLQAIAINAGTVLVDNNNITNIYESNSYSGSIICLEISGATNATVTNNIFGTGSAGTPDGSGFIQCDGGAIEDFNGTSGYIYGILNNSTSTSSTTYNGNYFYYLIGYDGGMGGYVACIVHTAAGPAIITNNTINGPQAHGSGEFSGNSYTSDGIYLFPTASTTGNLIEGNNIAGPYITLTSVTGYGSINNGIRIPIGSSNTCSGTIDRNIIWDMRNADLEGTTEGIYIYSTNGGNGNWNIYNNMVALKNNGSTSNCVGIYGIEIDLNSSSTTNIQYNTVYISGSNGGSAVTGHNFSSYAMFRQPNSSGSVAGDVMTLKNNIFINNRLVSNGFVTGHFAIGNVGTSNYATNFNTSDYNFLAVNNGSKSFVGEWGTATETALSNWRTASSKDANSFGITTPTTGSSVFSSGTLNADNLFVNALSDLHISTSDGQSYQFIGDRATPISITTDINGETRSGSTPDIGADEFTACTPPGQPTVSVTNNCDGTSTLSTTATGTLSWSTGASSTSISVTTAGTYSVTAASGGCTSTPGTGTATAANTPTAPTVSVTNNCDGTSRLSTTSTGTLSWSTGATTSAITVTTAGTYSVHRTVNGCTSTDGTGTATAATAPGTPSVSVTNNCNGTSTLSTTATGTLSWNTGATTSSITVTTAGTYSVTQTVNSCTSASGTGAATAANTPATPTVNVSSACGSSTLSTTSAGSLSWSTGATTSAITVTNSNTYSVTVTVSGCSATGTGAGAPYSSPTASASHTDASCNGASNGIATSTTSGGTTPYAYSWNTGATTSSITGPSNTYTLTVTDAHGCTSIGTVDIGQPLPITTPTVTVTDGCGSSVLTASNYTGTLSWSNSATTSSITVTNAATYSVTQTVGVCTSTAGTGTSNPGAGPSTPSVTVIENCNGSSTLSTTATGTLSWSPGGATGASITVSTAGTYSVTTTVGGCTSSPGTGIAYAQSTPATPTVSASNNCNGTSTLTASGYTGTLSWSTGASSPSITVSVAATYSVTQTINTCTSANGTGVADLTGGCSFSYTVRAFIQGYYLGSSKMSPLLKLLGASSNPNAVDTVTIELHTSGAPTTAAVTYSSILYSNDSIPCVFPSTASGNSYYIVIKHRNSITTYSAATHVISSGGSYDFTTGAGQAYNSNMVNLGSGIYGIYSGDVNQDGAIDASDVTTIKTGLSSMLIGVYNLKDVTGDGFVDEDDYRIVQNNAPLGLTIQHP